jgi:hypothetical protein
MEALVDNYLDLTIEEVYDVISKVNAWPRSFDKFKKIKLMNSMIKYFEVREEYEKCAILQQLVEGLENNQQSFGRSRIEPN